MQEIGEERISVHQLDQQDHTGQLLVEEPGLVGAAVLPSEPIRLTKQIYGWHPHWSENRLRNYRFDLLSAASYFSYEVNPSTGEAKSVSGWDTTKLAEAAVRHGVEVELTVTNFGSGNNRKLLTSPDARRKLIDNLKALVLERHASGVCVDFELVGKTERDSLTTFLRQLREVLGGASISIALPAVDWSRAFDLEQLCDVVDRFIIMAYDYYWSTAKTAGPVSPLAPSEKWGRWSVADSIDTYLDRGAPPSKLLAGLPFYGYQWPTDKLEPPAKTMGRASALSYAVIRAKQQPEPRWDSCSQTPFYAFEKDGRCMQLWFENADSLRRKCELIKQKNIAGVGVWALGYDSGFPELWQTLEEQFAEPVPLT